MPNQFAISVPDDLLGGVSRRAANCGFPIEPENEAWELRVPVHFMREIQFYFIDGYDWRATERSCFLNRQMGFGAGIHPCVGSFLARAMFESTMREVLTQSADYGIERDIMVRCPSVAAINGYASISATFTLAAASGASFG